jgi:uncharacterized protein (DUF433 family)
VIDAPTYPRFADDAENGCVGVECASELAARGYNGTQSACADFNRGGIEPDPAAAFVHRLAKEDPMVDRRPIALPDGSVVHSDPEILGGTPVFVGTRVPVQFLIDHIEAGVTVDEFLEDYPSVRRSQVLRFLQG